MKTQLLSRHELYNLVWSEPIIKLARKYGLSDNGSWKESKKRACKLKIVHCKTSKTRIESGFPGLSEV